MKDCSSFPLELIESAGCFKTELSGGPHNGKCYNMQFLAPREDANSAAEMFVLKHKMFRHCFFFCNNLPHLVQSICYFEFSNPLFQMFAVMLGKPKYIKCLKMCLKSAFNVNSVTSCKSAIIIPLLKVIFVLPYNAAFVLLYLNMQKLKIQM